MGYIEINYFLVWKMNTLLFGIVFLISLFIYIHLHSQWKTSSELEVYDVAFSGKDALNDMCDTKQPILIRGIFNMIDSTLEDIFETYGTYEVNVVSLDPCVGDKEKLESLLLPLSLQECLTLLQKQSCQPIQDDETPSKDEIEKDNTRESEKDEKSNHQNDDQSDDRISRNTYVSWENKTFLDESGLRKGFYMNDLLLRPPLLCHREYDMYLGNEGSITPLRYTFSFRNYIHLHSGEIRIKLIPPIYSRYLRENRNDMKMIYTSPMNCWSIQDEYKKEYNKVKSVEVHMKAGDTIHIPSYWWWSISFEMVSMIENMRYYTPMNMIANSDRYVICALQNTNVKHLV